MSPERTPRVEFGLAVSVREPRERRIWGPECRKARGTRVKTKNARQPISRRRALTGRWFLSAEKKRAPRRQLSSKQLSNTRFPQHVYWQQLTDFASRSVAQIRRQLRRNRRLVCVADGPGWPGTSWRNGGADRTTVARSAGVVSDVAGHLLCIPLARSGSLLRCPQVGRHPSGNRATGQHHHAACGREPDPHRRQEGAAGLERRT